MGSRGDKNTTHNTNTTNITDSSRENGIKSGLSPINKNKLRSFF
jgi:hypothetical protein